MLSKRNRRLTAPDILREINPILNSPIGITTVKNRLHEANKQKRLNWAREHKDWTVEQWEKVLWSDESKFELFSSKRKVFVRRFSNERVSEQCLVPTVKHGGGFVTVWGCFGKNKIGKLYRINSIMKKKEYLNILKTQMIPSGAEIFHGSFASSMTTTTNIQPKCVKPF